MSKKDYLKILQKYDEKAKEELIKFLIGTPYFAKWSKNMLLKIISCFSKVKTFKG
jgi:hypothetical protein